MLIFSAHSSLILSFRPFWINIIHIRSFQLNCLFYSKGFSFYSYLSIARETRISLCSMFCILNWGKKNMILINLLSGKWKWIKRVQKKIIPFKKRRNVGFIFFEIGKKIAGRYGKQTNGWSNRMNAIMHTLIDDRKVNLNFSEFLLFFNCESVIEHQGNWAQLVISMSRQISTCF